MSGEFPKVDKLLEDLVGAIRPPVKACSRRDDFAQRANCRFRAVVDYAVAQGASFRSLARAADCTVRHLIDCYDGRRNVPAWMFEAMPKDARAEGVRVEIETLRKVG
jgi:hypothetical protein